MGRRRLRFLLNVHRKDSGRLRTRRNIQHASDIEPATPESASLVLRAVVSRVETMLEWEERLEERLEVGGAFQ